MVILTEKRLCKAYSPILNLPLSHNVAVVTSFPYEKKKTPKAFHLHLHTTVGDLPSRGEWFMI